MESDKIAPIHGMLSRSHLMIVSPDKPFLHAVNGVVFIEQAAQTITLDRWNCKARSKNCCAC